MSGDILTFPQQPRRDARDVFPRLLTQEELDAQEAAQKIRALWAIPWMALKALVCIIGILGLLGFALGA